MIAVQARCAAGTDAATAMAQDSREAARRAPPAKMRRRSPNESVLEGLMRLK
jgi:hypothetical protein